MLELKALRLTQGMHGMVSQTEGLAKALKLNFKHKNKKTKRKFVKERNKKSKHEPKKMKKK